MLIPIYKNKKDAHFCGNYRGIKLISDTMKVWERIIEARLRDRVKISKQQYGFMPGKRITDAMFALKMLMEKYREGQRELHCVFVNLALSVPAGLSGVFQKSGLFSFKKNEKKCTLSLLNISAFICQKRN